MEKLEFKHTGRKLEKVLYFVFLKYMWLFVYARVRFFHSVT